MERKKEIEKMIIRRIVVGPLETNCYLVADEAIKDAVIIDPGAEPDKISSAIKENGFKPKFILLTHEHPDHIGAITNLWPCDVLRLKNGENIKIGKTEIMAAATPGHTPDSVCFIAEEHIFSGDTLFKGGIGRTDLKGGNYFQIKESLKRLMEFPDHFKIFPGHGEETTIGEERKNNPFLQ
jgi:glyoxylase-like metal-dependent hydrolase (beta-lactamase superfamily II)